MINDLTIVFTPAGAIIGRQSTIPDYLKGFWLKDPRFLRDIKTDAGPALAFGKIAGFPNMIFISGSCSYYVNTDEEIKKGYIEATTGLTMPRNMN